MAADKAFPSRIRAVIFYRLRKGSVRRVVAVRVEIDWDLCIGSGLCVAASAETFELVPHEGSERARLKDPGAPDEVLLACAGACPMLAIRLRDDRGRWRFPPLLGERPAGGGDDQGDQAP
jgi:ferredoxin